MQMDSGRSSPLPLYRSNSLRGNLNRTSLVRRNQSMSAKQISFFRNGDRYFNGLKLAVSNEKYKEFDSLLAELSKKLDLPTGAVRYIFNAQDSSIITDISQLQYGVPYVCSSNNTFREIEGGYGKQMHNWSITKSPKLDSNFNCSKPNILTNHDNNGQFSHISEGESGKDFIKPKLVTVIRNGKPPQKKVTLLLNSKTAISLDQVLDQLSARGCLGKVDKLFTVDCHVVKSLKDLFDDDTVFIALQANEKFPDDGIELDPNSYRITPYRELKRPSSMTVKRSSSLRSRKYKDENQNLSSINGHTSSTPINKLMNLKVLRPKSTSMKQIEQNNEELYPTSVFESESSESETEYELNSMFGIKRDKQSVHSSYKIGRIIGDGNFAVVRECRDRKTQRSYALKVINKAKVKGKEHMIENEILILRKISHPNIVKLFDEYETAKEIFLVMELVTGGDLFDAIVANTRFSEPDSALMICDLAMAVRYLHEKSIIHRDIKPENLLVVCRSDGRKSIKLADFGLSVEVDSPMYLVCGTPTYVAPEILDESGYGLKVDCWAIGVILYILLCGFPPFRSANHDQEELFEKILGGEFEYLSPFWDDISDGPRDLIDRLLVVDASERYESYEVLEHFWIKKWTRPSEKLHCEMSVAEESNKINRQRLRGIALAIQVVISLLHHVRNKRILNESLKNTSHDMVKVTHKPLQSISRIPLPKPSCGYHIANIRRNLAVSNNTDIKSTVAPDCSFKKGHFKREEVISTSNLKNRSTKLQCSAKSPIKKSTNPIHPIGTVGMTSNQTSAKKDISNKAVKRRPVSLININHLSNDNSKPVETIENKEKRKFTSDLIVVQSSSRARPISMIVSSKDLSKLTADIGDLHIIAGGCVGERGGFTDKVKPNSSNKKLTSEKGNIQKAPPKPTQRPVSLLIKEMKKPRVAGPESLSSNGSMSLSDIRRSSLNTPPVDATNRQNSLTKGTINSVNSKSASSLKSIRSLSSPKNSFISNVPYSTIAQKRASFPLSEKRETIIVSNKNKSEVCKSGIQITTRTNKIQNIKFPDGKIVDKETKTTTTVSIPEHKLAPRGPNLLKKVENLAREIENFSNDNPLDLHSEYLPSNSSSDDEEIECNIQEYTDRFSETEYLSVANVNEDT
ncbi:serine/threonine-protein kinase DCLK1 isoform X3 [Hydra vulgaris]|uniref:non-specific serine/threonine protein kinase n=1 Tax=Hydra vulgaris TaxID=6087 RepID=A0ABM4CZF1_HYDVU